MPRKQGNFPRHQAKRSKPAGRAGHPVIHRRQSLPEGRIVVGRNSVREILRHSPGRFIKIYIAGEKERLFSRADTEIIARHNILLEKTDQQFLNNAAGNESHQSVLAIVKERPAPTLKEFLTRQQDKEKSLVLVLDDIQDPQNLGAILRAAECFAVDLVIFSRNKGVGLTPSVSKASVGASELLEIMPVSNLVDTLRKLKDAGYWTILADADKEAKSLRGFEFPQRSVIVMGSEASGAQALIKKEADFTLFIDLYGKISSLNVSQATALFLYACRESLNKS